MRLTKFWPSMTGADQAFLVRGDLIHKFFCQVLGKHSDEAIFS